MVVAVVAAVIIMVVAVARVVRVMAFKKGFGKNPKKFSLWKKGGLPLGFLIQKGV